MAHHQKRSFVVALLGGAVGLAGSYIMFIAFGMVTGVVAMCAWAPEWWVHVYTGLAVLIPFGAAWSAVKARRMYLRRVASSIRPS